MQLIRALVAVAWLGHIAAAQAPGETAASDTPTADDYRDVLAGEQPRAAVQEPAAATTSDDEPVTGTGRLGAYHDSDQTTVLRALATIAKEWGHWTMNGGVVIDAVTSASIDVKTSPALGKVDVVTGASGRSSTTGGEMSDTRYLGTVGAGWNDSSGHAVNLTTSVAHERDYASVSGGINGSIDVAERSTTLLGGFTVTDNWVSSVLDSTLHRKLAAVAWSAGVARVVTPSDAVRLRYDGKLSSGDLSSPYRNVRFGDWMTSTVTGGQVIFTHTLGSADGLPEKLPESRVSHALALEWVHALALGIGLHPAVRVAHDSWGVDSVTPSLELRIAKPGYRLQLGYRLYLQSRASFFAGKYTQDPTMYNSYTSDKELGGQLGHLGSVEMTVPITEPESPSDARMFLFAHADVFRYAYPGFELLASRTSEFVEAGVSWEH
ncbi:MAG: DUF3570 domain-containing protein [Kofleriaceae bacterium]